LLNEDWEVLAFYDLVCNDVCYAEGFPARLDLPSVLVRLQFSDYPEHRWRELVADAEFLFDELVVKPRLKKRRHR
jgi:hypothetical protein